jgi:hypothetical protein
MGPERGEHEPLGQDDNAQLPRLLQVGIPCLLSGGPVLLELRYRRPDRERLERLGVRRDDPACPLEHREDDVPRWAELVGLDLRELRQAEQAKEEVTTTRRKRRP